MEPRWWDADQLRTDERFVKSNETGSYFDHDADLSVEEMREIHERFRKITSAGLYKHGQWREIIQPMLKELDEALYSGATDYSHFHIRVFEWESGLG